MLERVLVTGGGGYIGSVLVPTLLANNYRVRVLDTFKHGLTLARHSADPGFEPVQGDCRDINVLKECLKDVNWIIPLAAIVGAPACERDHFAAASINTDAIARLVSFRLDIPILFPTTNSGYGTTEFGAVCTEDTPLNPISLYGYTKSAAEDILLQSGRPAASFRLATVFGPSPRMRLDLLVNDFTYRAVTDRAIVLYEPTFRRNFMHVQDVARLFLFGIQNFDRLKEKKVYNAGLPTCFNKRELCNLISHEVDFQFFEAETGSDPDKRDYNVSVERLRQAGFECTRGLRTGVQELVKLYKMLPQSSFGNI